MSFRFAILGAMCLTLLPVDGHALDGKQRVGKRLHRMKKKLATLRDNAATSFELFGIGARRWNDGRPEEALSGASSKLETKLTPKQRRTAKRIVAKSYADKLKKLTTGTDSLSWAIAYVKGEIKHPTFVDANAGLIDTLQRHLRKIERAKEGHISYWGRGRFIDYSLDLAPKRLAEAKTTRYVRKQLERTDKHVAKAQQLIERLKED